MTSNNSNSSWLGWNYLSIKYGAWDSFKSPQNFTNEGKVTGVSSWGLFSDDNYPWDGALANFAWTSDNRDSNDPIVVIGNGSNIDSCDAFELAEDDYIDGYQVFYGDYIYGLVFHTSQGDSYECPAAITDSNVTESDLVVYWDSYLSGFVFSASGDVIDGIQFQFSPIHREPIIHEIAILSVWQLVLVIIVGIVLILGCVAVIIYLMKRPQNRVTNEQIAMSTV